MANNTDPVRAPPSSPDRMAIRMLVAAGFVTDAKANEALQIAHGFISGPLEPPSAPVGVDVSDLCRKARARFSPSAHPHSVADWIEQQALSQQPAAPSGEAVAEYVRATVTALERIGEDQAVVAGVDTSALADKGRSLLAAPQQPAAVDGAMSVLTELVATLAATGTVTGGRIYFPERQTRELLKKACDALAAQQQGGRDDG